MSRADIQDQETNSKDYVIPAVLLGVGILIYVIHALIFKGGEGLMRLAILLPIQLVLQVVLGVVACFITARLMGTAFGDVRSAIVMLAAIFIFPGAVTCFIPHVGWVIALVIYWGMLERLFELEAIEAIVLAIVIWVVTWGALLFLGAVGLAMIH